MLEVHHNPFTTVPPVLADLKQLQALSLEECGLTSLQVGSPAPLAARSRRAPVQETNLRQGRGVPPAPSRALVCSPSCW